jgi:L-asparaginase II
MRGHAMATRPVPARAEETAETWPTNPVLTRLWRDGHVESQHRGAWVLVDSTGAALEGAGDWRHPVFARSSTKSLQALPLIETGAAERYGFGEDELALALASHDAEPCHVDRVAVLLARLGLSVEHLKCGAHAPWSVETRRALARQGERASALHNNCSGKHAAFLALALHLGVEPEHYLDPERQPQRLVRDAVLEITGAQPGEFGVAIDGCSAPTFRMPLSRLATGLARVANPSGLAGPRRRACERMTAAAARFPELIGGSRGRLCTDLLRASGGRIFPKLGGEAVYVFGVRGADRGLAVKVDDGAYRGMEALVVALCERFGFLSGAEAASLAEWRARPVTNWAGLVVGRIEVCA